MAYNPISIGNLSTASKYLYKIKQLSGGIACDDEGNDSNVSEMSNMYFENGIFLTRRAFCQRGDFVEGEYKSALSEEYYDNIIFHAGNNLYRFDGEEIHILCENVGEKGFFLRMNAKVYFYSVNEKVYETDKDFTCKEAEIYVPQIIKVVGNTSEANEPFNMLTNRVRCQYWYNTTNPNVELTLPYPIDKNEKVYIRRENKEMKIYNIDFFDKNPKFIRLAVDFGKTESDYIEIEFAIERSQKTVVEYLSKIYGSKIAFCYGGTTKDGSRAFVTGNPEYPSMYFRSELKNPLFFPDTSQETLGDGSENVNGAEKRYEKMYFFTDRHIYAMSYAFSEEDGASFTVNSINTGVGCNMYGSVRALDNTIVFADKTDGVFIMQSTDIFDELNILPISGNLKGNIGIPFGKQGKCFSCDHNRKYYICNGQGVYMWDYGRVPFYSGTEYRTSQKSLPWFKICDARDFADIFALNGKLYFLASKEKCGIYEYSDGNYSDTANATGEVSQQDFECSFTTKKYDFGNPYACKRLLKFSFDYENESGKERITNLSFYADGKAFYTTKTTLDKTEGRQTVKLPSYYGNNFSVKVTVNGGGVGFRDLAFLWQKAERVKFYD